MPHDQPILPSPRRPMGANLLLGAIALLPLLALLPGLLAPAARGPLLWAAAGLYLAGVALLARLIGARLRAGDQALAAREVAHATLARRTRELEHTLELQQADLAARAGAEVALSRQLAYSQALAHCSQTLLRQDPAAADLQATLAQALDILRRALDLDRLYVYQNVGSADACVAHTIAGARPPEISDFRFAAGMSMRLVPQAVRAALARGESVGGPVGVAFADAPDFQQILREGGTRSIQLVPIHQHGQWWGCLSASDMREPRLWDAPDCQLLHTGAEMIAAFLQSWHAGMQLREREEMLRAIGDNLPLGVVYRMLQSPDGSYTIQYVSAGVEQLYGITPAQLYADASLAKTLWHPETSAPVSPSDAQPPARPGNLDLEIHHTMRSGELRWVHIRSTSTPLEDGQVRWDGVALDVTARHEAEQALRRSRQQLQQAMWAADLALWEWDGATQTTTISPEMPALLGYDPAEAGDPLTFWQGRIHPDDRSLMQAAIRMGLSGQATTFEAEYRMPHKSGAWHWMRSRGRIVEHDPDGRPLRAIGITHDITAQKQAEQEIQAQRDFAQRVITLMGQGLAVLGADGHIAYINPRLSQIIGYQLDELIGHDPEEITPQGLHSKLAEEQEQRARGETTTYELQLRHKDGSLRDMQITAAPIMRDGVSQGTISVLTDVSDHKRAEEDLRQAKESAEAADRAKSRFLAHMSHEIRTPLNAVIGMASLLQETPLNPDQRELLATIRTGGETLLDIINNILDFSKIESGQMSLATRPFDLLLCVEEAVHLVALQAAQKQLALQLQIDPDVPPLVLGDELRLRQVLVNLLANAVKFTAQGGVTLHVVADADQGAQDSAPADAGLRQRPAPRILFEVHDTGIGISPDQLERIFDPFTQADPDSPRRFGGTGLGLAISRQLVDAMGGTLQAGSTPGHGSTFTVQVPLRPAPEGVATHSHRPTLVGRQLLLVAGPGPEREQLAAMCRGWGMQPTLIDSGQAALAQLESGLPFDIAVVALGPPDQIGILTARALRDHRAWAQRPLIIVTDRAQPPDADAPQRCNGMLSRPVRRTRFADALAAALAGANTGATVDAGALRVLLAEDNLVNQQVTVRLLQQLQVHVDLAVNGRQAVDAVRQRPYDLVLMDAQMPELDGVQATQQIRDLGDTVTQPYIVALTALAMAGDRERFLAAGMNDYLSKPVQIDDLRSALARLRSWGDPPEPAAPSAQAAAPAPDPGAVIDWDVLDQLSQALGADGEETILQLVGLFRSEIISQINVLDTMIEADNTPQVTHIAHRLFGSCRQMGAVMMANLAFAIERAALHEDLPALPALADALRDAYTQALDQLSRRYTAQV